MKLKLLFALLLIGMISACDDDDDDNACNTTDVTYTNTIATIFDGTCAVSGCHVVGNEAVAFFSLEGYANASLAASFGRMVGAVSHDEGFTPMPKDQDQLDQCSIDQITAWVAAGAPE